MEYPPDIYKIKEGMKKINLLIVIFIFCIALLLGNKIFNTSYLPEKLQSALKNNVNNIITISPPRIDTHNSTNALSSVVNIKNSGNSGGFFGMDMYYGQGTGVIVREDGYILTSLYVVEQVGTITVQLHDGSSHEAKVFAADTKNNIVILKIDAEGLTPIKLGDSSQVTLGEPVSVVGNPLSETLSNPITGGTISGINYGIPLQNGQKINIFQVDASALANSIGGLVLNAQGELIGMTTAIISSNSTDIGLATPINDLKESLSKIVSTEINDSQNITIGIQGVDTSHGVIIERIAEGSAAEKAGLQSNDLIIKVDDKPITSVADITAIKNNHKKGDALAFSVFRNGELLQINVILE